MEARLVLCPDLVSGHFFALSHFMQLRATLHNLNKKMIVGMIAIILQAFQ